MNQINLIGRVGKDPEIKDLESGTKVAKFSLAVSEKYTKGGEKVEHTEWFNVAIFGKLAEVAQNWVHKGDQLFVSGKITSREYDDKEGVKRRVYEVTANSIEMLGSKKEASQEHTEPNNGPLSSNRLVTTPLDQMPEDDLPF
jgi:single-strand DNA-binding protein